MSGVNKVLLVGDISDKPLFKETSNDTAQLTFELTTTEVLNKEEGKFEHVEKNAIVLHNMLASKANYLLRTGMTLYLEGQVKTKSYYDGAGVKRYHAEIHCDKFSVLSDIIL